MKLLHFKLLLIVGIYIILNPSHVHAQICCYSDPTCTAYGPLLRCLTSFPGFTGRCDDHHPVTSGSGDGYCAEPPPSPNTPRFYLPLYEYIFGPQFKFDYLNGAPDIGSIITASIPYVFVIAGLLLLAYLLYGGFHLVTSFGSPKAILEAWVIIFRAIVGFVMIFASFWLVRIIEIVFKIEII